MTPQLFSAWRQVRGFLAKHHPILFFAMIALLLGTAIFMLSQILVQSHADVSDNISTIGVFDQKTVDKIKDLHISGDNSNSTLTFPTPRANPFEE